MGIVTNLVWPLILEPLYNLYGWATYSSYQRGHNHDKYRDVESIFYSSGYNISFLGLEKCHPFDSKKYGRCFKLLQSTGAISPNARIHVPEVCPRALLWDMSKLYLLSHCYSYFLCKYLEVPLCFFPSCGLRYRVLNPMLRATMGTIEGCCMALERGWALNLSGGYHHARLSYGGGFCVYPDITLAIRQMRRWHAEVRHVMIIDLDAHQGNGYERDFLNDDSVFVLDMYNHSIYPGDEVADHKIGVDVSISSQDSTEDYREKLKEGLDVAFTRFRDVDFILYNAGTDILEGDQLGRLHISEEGVIKRDEMIFALAFEKRIPILMVLSGGYQKINAEVIAHSIQNLFAKFPQMKSSALSSPSSYAHPA